MAQTPRDSLEGTRELTEWIENNSKSLIDGTHQIPENMLGGKSDQARFPPPEWPSSGNVKDKRAGFIFRFNTCNGCHHDNKITGPTLFQHINSSSLSPFLSGKVVLDQALPGRVVGDKEWDELGERGLLMMGWTGAPSVLSEGALQSALRARANRTH